MPCCSLHVFRVGEVLAEFEQRRRAVAMRAAGAEGRRARRRSCRRMTCELGLAGLADASPARRVSRPLRRSAGISSVALMSGMRICARTEGLRPRVSGMPAQCRAGNVLPKRRADDVGRLLRAADAVNSAVADVLFEEAAAFLDDDHVLAELGELARRAARRPGSSCPSAESGRRRSDRCRPAHARGTGRPCR